jgi:hypothetical protein
MHAFGKTIRKEVWSGQNVEKAEVRKRELLLCGGQRGSLWNWNDEPCWELRSVYEKKRT